MHILKVLNDVDNDNKVFRSDVFNVGHILGAAKTLNSVTIVFLHTLIYTGNLPFAVLFRCTLSDCVIFIGCRVVNSLPSHT
jgi:hypothetical protein